MSVFAINSVVFMMCGIRVRGSLFTLSPTLQMMFLNRFQRLTIPAMKRTGFRASYAGAIEACASTGAVLAPPVMGATAFVMAQFLNVSYAEVALAAAIPALLYYFGLFMQVDAYAARHGLKPEAPGGSAA